MGHLVYITFHIEESTTTSSRFCIVFTIITLCVVIMLHAFHYNSLGSQIKKMFMP